MGRKRSAVSCGVAVTMMTGVGVSGLGTVQAQAANGGGMVSIAEVLGCEEQTEFPASTADDLMGGALRIQPWGSVKLPILGPVVDIDWGINPFRHPTWETKFRSLRWVDTLVDKAVDRNEDLLTRTAARNLAEGILKDWIKDNRLYDPSPLPFTWVGASAVAQRAEGLLCDRRAFGEPAWMDQALLDHGRFLTDNWSGTWNHGTMEAITLYRIGCITGDAADRALGKQRMVDSFKPNKLGPVLDAEGATNEQAVGYEDFQYRLWNKAMRTLQACGDSVPDVMRQRIAKIPAFLAAATQPDGTLVQLGDTYKESAGLVAGTPLEYMVTKGRSGPRPTKRISVYKAGYVFGHSGFGQTRPFGKESFYSLRFGAPRQVHGHFDHTSITYFAHGFPMLVDSGHDGYQDSANRDFLRSQAGHNVLMVGGVKPRDVATSLVRRKIEKDWQFYETADRAFGMERTRSVLFAQGPDIAVILDRTASTRTTHSFRQLWHLDPSMKVQRQKRGVAVATPNDGTDARLWMIPVDLDGGRIRTSSTKTIKGRTVPRQGWVSEGMLDRQQAPVVQMSSKGRAAEMLTVMVPASKQSKVTTSIKGMGHGVKVLTVTIDGKAHKFAISSGGKISAF
ncbi:MAG TPA: heparinase II/III family protein [Sporichthya sp.]|nr:heparinase II/III family protein [Sporichthya sp.]